MIGQNVEHHYAQTSTNNSGYHGYNNSFKATVASLYLSIFVLIVFRLEAPCCCWTVTRVTSLCVVYVC